MEYFKVKDKVINGDTYYIAFTSNNMAVNMTGKADIAKTVCQPDENGEDYYTVEIDYDSPFDLNITDVEYELEPEDWDLIKTMSESKTKLTDNFTNFDPLVDKTVSMYGFLFPVAFLKQKINETLSTFDKLIEADESTI